LNTPVDFDELTRRGDEGQKRSASGDDQDQPRTQEDIMTSEITANFETANAAPASPKSRAIGRYLPAVGRVLLGLLFFVSGLNGFLNFLPQPTTPMPAGATAFVTALMSTGYMFKLIMGTQLVVGALLLANRFVPLALALLAPFMVNSIAFHMFLEPSGRPMALTVVAIQLYLVWCYREAFRPMLKARVPRA
jgi:uncharacterized membrane protein YphA (DoxX/SURF4 family)